MKNTNKIIYKAESYTGRKVGKGGFMERVGWQVVATDSVTGKRRAVFDTNRGKSPCLKSNWLASHYSSGLNKNDRETMKGYKIWAEDLAKKFNEEV